MRTPTLHAELMELERAVSIAERARLVGNENITHIRAAFEGVRRSLSQTLPASSVADQAAGVIRDYDADRESAWVIDAMQFLRNLAAGRWVQPNQTAAARAAALLDRDTREALGEHPMVRSCGWVDDVRDLLRDLAAGKIGEATKIDIALPPMPSCTCSLKWRSMNWTANGPTPHEASCTCGDGSGTTVSEALELARKARTERTSPVADFGDVIARDAAQGVTSSQIRDEIIGKVGMMASARTPEMQARYEAALIREKRHLENEFTTHTGKRTAAAQQAATETLAAAKASGDDPQRWASAFVTSLRNIGCANAFDLKFVTNWFATSLESTKRVAEERLAEANRQVDQARAIKHRELSITGAEIETSSGGVTSVLTSAETLQLPVATIAGLNDTKMTSGGPRQRHLYDAADRSRYCKWCHEEESHPVHVARPAAEIAYTAPTNIPAAPAPEPERFDDSRQKRLSRVQLAIDDVRTAITLVALEADASVASELERRVNVLIDAFHRSNTGPTAELVGLRFFHDNVTAWCQRVLGGLSGYKELGEFCHRVVDKGGAAFMNPHAEGPFTTSGGHPYRSAPAPQARLTDEQLERAKWCSVRDWANGPLGTLFDQWRAYAGIQPDTYESSIAWASFRAARDYFHTPSTDLAGSVVRKAELLVSRSIHNRTSSQQRSRGNYGELLQNDFEALTVLAEAVAAYQRARKV